MINLQGSQKTPNPYQTSLQQTDPISLPIWHELKRNAQANLAEARTFLTTMASNQILIKLDKRGANSPQTLSQNSIAIILNQDFLFKIQEYTSMDRQHFHKKDTLIYLNHIKKEIAIDTNIIVLEFIHVWIRTMNVDAQYVKK